MHGAIAVTHYVLGNMQCISFGQLRQNPVRWTMSTHLKVHGNAVFAAEIQQKSEWINDAGAGHHNGQ